MASDLPPHPLPTARSPVILGFDPGRDKCGLAVVGYDQQLHYHAVVASKDVLLSVQQLCQDYPVTQLVMGDQTTAKQWKQQLETALVPPLPISLVDERYTSLEARDRYWQMYPPQGLTRLVPLGLRTVPRPIDDIVAVLLIERYLART